MGSAAIWACTAAIFSGLELTHCKPELLATLAMSSIGSAKLLTLGMLMGAALGADVGAAATGEAMGALFCVAACPRSAGSCAAFCA